MRKAEQRIAQTIKMTFSGLKRWGGRVKLTAAKTDGLAWIPGPSPPIFT